MERVETITWMPFPENKPKTKGMLLIQTSDNGKPGTGWYQAEWTSTYEAKPKTYKEKWILTSMSKIKNVVAFAELPKPYDPAAPLNFLTALELWKDKKTICSYVSGVMYNLDVDGIMESHFADGTSSTDETFTLAEIEGEWKLI